MINANYIKKKIFDNYHLVFLALIFYLAVITRLATINSKTILDYDPWWHFRHTRELLDNGLKPIRWDILSFYPPGRPVDFQLGYYYLIAIAYKIFTLFKSIDLVKFAQWIPVILSGLVTIPAYLTGRIITNKWGGLTTALFAVLTPAFISVSMFGYVDDDVTVVLYSFLAAFSLLYMLKKNSIFSYVLATISFTLFALSWNQGWYLLYFAYAFIPFYWIFLVLVDIRHKKQNSLNAIAIENIRTIWKKVVIPLLIVSIGGTVLAWLANAFGIPGFDPFYTFTRGLEFFGGKLLIVNISVAELQSINIFTKDGFLAVANRVGLIPFVLAIIGLPLLVIFKFVKKLEITFAEVFAFLWLAITFYMILSGVRFALLFSIAAATASGFVIGNLAIYFKKTSTIFKQQIPIAVIATVFGVILFAFIWHISFMLQFASQTGGFDISQNWIDMMDYLKKNGDKDTLIVTWWDPGHIITGYTGLKVMADGAHCAPGTCVPYDHNIRIQDAGRILSTKDENEALSVIKKYVQLTPQQCSLSKEKFGSIVPADACKPIKTVYVIASNDLIQKYHWLSYFGQGASNARDFFVLPLSNVDQQQGLLQYANGALTVAVKDNQLVPVINNRQVVKQISYVDNSGQRVTRTFENATNTIDGLLWLEPGYQTAIYMDPDIKESLFTRMYFYDGQGLKNFQLVFSNPEIKLFKVSL